MSRQKGDNMREVLISIQPKWVEKICRGEKTVEVRKTKPKLETPFKVYIYCTKERRKTDFITKSEVFGYINAPEHTFCNRAKEYDANGKVIGEFVCDKVYDLRCLPKEYYGKPVGTYEQFICENSCLSFDDIKAYGKGTSIYGWHITDLVVYDKPRELSEFRLPCDHKNDCCTCKRAIYTMDKAGVCSFHRCSLEEGLTRPPQSWRYVERINK